MLNKVENTVNLPIHQHEVSPCISAASFWMPEFLNLSAWIEHAPFTFWLMQATTPASVVELGVHHGYSYFIFCQAVQQLVLSCKCYAIDTWKGDEHSGFYGEDVFLKVHAYNAQKYSGFSQLMRSTFDDALEYFSDKSIDILHIDGRHFYEDVKHDFESWLPKLSDRSIVLIHDINVKEKNFRVFQFWEEIRHQFPHFEFMHGHGLGVLGVGQSIPTKLRILFEINNSNEGAKIRHMYSRLGGALSDRFQLATQTELIAKLSSDLKLAPKESQMLSLSEQNTRQSAEIVSLKNKIEALEAIVKNEEEKKKVEAKLEMKDCEMLQLKNQLSIVENALKHRETIIQQLSDNVSQIYSSRFWRFTLPLRKIFRIE